MYAYKKDSYRSIAKVSDASEGESVSETIPATVLEEVKKLEMRNARTDLLRNTDWTQMPDSKLTSIEKTQWMAYRQLLRDLPNVAGFPNIQWPAPPGVITEADAVPRVFV